MRRALLAVCVFLVLPAGVEAKVPTARQGERAVKQYVKHLQRDYRPSGVTWNARWVRLCQQGMDTTFCSYGLEGQRNGKPYECAGVADVTFRRGRRFGWGDVQPTDIVGTRRLRIEPELSFDCWGPESPVIRVG